MSKRASAWTVGLVVLATAFCGVLTAAEPDAAAKQAAAELEKAGGLVLRVAQNVDWYEVTFPGAGAKVTDEQLVHLKAIPNLTRVNIAGAAVTDEGLKHIAGLTKLTHLHLEKTKITDAGLAHLKGLTELEYLNVYGTEVTDAGLEHLKGLKKLKRLYIWQTKVTEGGAKGFEEAVAGVKTVGVIPPPVIEPRPAEEPKPEAPAADASKPVNTLCPISGKEIDPSKTFTFKDEVIGFCCDNCLGKFKEKPEEFIGKVNRDAKPAKPTADATKPVNTLCPISGKEIDPSKTFTFKDEVIGFCCDNCLGKFKEKPEEFIGKLKRDAKPAEKKEEKKPDAAAAAPAVTETAAGEPINDKCPVSGEGVNPDKKLVFEGKTVGFCCGNCLAKFKQDPSKFAGKITAK